MRKRRWVCEGKEGAARSRLTLSPLAPLSLSLQPFADEAEAEKAAHVVAMETWRNSLTTEDIRRQNAYLASQKKKGKKGGMARLRDPAKPKMPVPPFFHYLSEVRQRLSNDLPATELARNASIEWKSMSKEAKEVGVVACGASELC